MRSVRTLRLASQRTRSSLYCRNNMKDFLNVTHSQIMHVVRLLQVLTDFCAEDADVAFGVPEDALLEIGLPYRLQ